MKLLKIAAIVFWLGGILVPGILSITFPEAQWTLMVQDWCFAIVSGMFMGYLIANWDNV